MNMKDYTNTSKKNIISALRDKGVDVNNDVEWYELDDEIEKIKEDKSGALIDRTITEISNDSIKSIGSYAFQSCSALTTAIFPAATQISDYAFGKCQRLTTVNLPAVKGIGSNAFANCTALTTVNLPAVISIGSYAFQSCSALTTAIFPTATNISSYAFQNCSVLTTVNFPAVTVIQGTAFGGCKKLTTVNFPAVTSIRSNAFQNCSALTALILRSETMTELTNVNVFTGTPIKSGTGYIYVPAALIDSYKTATNWTTYANQFRAIEDYPDICGGAE